MDVQEFTRLIGRMSPGEIAATALEIESHLSSAGDEVDWWRATIAIDRVLKQNGRGRLAAVAASSATRAVLAAAVAAGVELPDAGATSVARAAGYVARGMVAGDEAAPALAYLLRNWSAVLVPAGLH